MKYVLILAFFTTLQFAHGAFDSERLSEEKFNAVISLMEKKFVPYAREFGRELEFYSDYDSDWVQAFARRWETDQLIIYGGVAGIPGITEDVLMLVICHELGHLYGGTPYSDEYNRLSLEGQADYWAGSECFKEVASKDTLPRLTSAALVLTSWFADNGRLPRPRIDVRDTSVVTETLKTHPAPQCRLDTILAGAEGQERPCCWYLCR